METSQPCNALAADADADDYPRWVMFSEKERHCWGLPADPKTVAHARTSNGLSVRASLRLAPPPAVSHLDVNFDDSRLKIYHSVIATHGASVLFRMSMTNNQQQLRKTTTTDHFVYRSGDGTDRLPSLSLLPPCYKDEKSTDVLIMERNRTGILRLGDGELVVATNLNMNIIACGDDGGTKRAEADLRLLCSRELQWKVKRLPVRHDVNKLDEVSFDWWVTDRVIPVADRFLYWVDLHKGIFFSDVGVESPELRFVPLPLDPLRRTREESGAPDSSRNLCATDGGAAVKFVLVTPRCRCVVTSCSCHAFTVTTWILRSTQDGGMGWEKDGVVDSGELWALDAYQCLPRLPMHLPVVSIHDPDIICFFVSEHWHIRSDQIKTTWLVIIDTRTKSLVGSASIFSSEEHYFAEHFLPSQVSTYFNTSPGSRNDMPPASERRRHKDIEVPQAVETEAPPATGCVGSPDQVIWAALQEIPGLTRDEMLRAYGVLACDDRRRYWSLVALPMNMRKDYCGMLVDMVGTNKQMQ